MYERTFVVNNPSYNTTIVNWDLTNIEIVELKSSFYRADGAYVPINFSPSSSNRATIYAGLGYSGIYFEASTSYSTISKVYITARYIKTTT